ncbi:hypothetical protein V1477_018955 [Vespula maculifrons]|uniref:Uncharacterized protein n=1 Tax=Vespula maculifrons TaxID=7453 RepID=A0ABD2ASY1_VESMC
MFLHRTTRTRSEVLEKPHLERTDGDDTVDRRVVARKIGQREEQRKWSLAGGRGGPAEQLVDSASLSVHVDANVSSSLSPLPLLFDTSVSKIAFIASNQRVMVPRTVDALAEHKVNRASVRKMLSKHDAARNNTTLRRHFVYVITKYLEGKHNSRLEMLLWTGSIRRFSSGRFDSDKIEKHALSVSCVVRKFTLTETEVRQVVEPLTFRTSPLYAFKLEIEQILKSNFVSECFGPFINSFGKM